MPPLARLLSPRGYQLGSQAQALLAFGFASLALHPIHHPPRRALRCATDAFPAFPPGSCFGNFEATHDMPSIVLSLWKRCTASHIQYIGGYCMGRQTSTIMEETEACDDLPQSGGDGVAKPDDNDPRPPQLAGDGDAGGPRDDDGPESPETAGGGEPVGQCGGVGREAARPPQQTKRPADGLGGSHHGSQDVRFLRRPLLTRRSRLAAVRTFSPGRCRRTTTRINEVSRPFFPWVRDCSGSRCTRQEVVLILELWVFEN